MSAEVHGNGSVVRPQRLRTVYLRHQDCMLTRWTNARMTRKLDAKGVRPVALRGIVRP